METVKRRSHAEVLAFGSNLTLNIRENEIFKVPLMNERLVQMEESLDELLAVLKTPPSEGRSVLLNEVRDLTDVQLNALVLLVQRVINRQPLSPEEKLHQLMAVGLPVLYSQDHGKSTFSAEPGREPGTLTLYAELGAVAHQWQYTENLTDFTDKRDLPITWVSLIKVEGLTPGRQYAFFHKPIGPKVKNAWEGPLVVTL